MPNLTSQSCGDSSPAACLFRQDGTIYRQNHKQLKFNVNKCGFYIWVLHIIMVSILALWCHHSDNKINKGFGVLMDRGLKFHEHTSIVTAKANCIILFRLMQHIP